MFFNEEFETLPREAIEALQLKRLKAMVARVQKSVPFYQESLEKAGITADSIQSLADLARLPFTYKQDMRDSYPYRMFAVPMEDIVRIHASSGTTGKPTVVGAPDSRAAEIYRTIARRVAVKVAERAKDMTTKFTSIVAQNT